MNWQGYKNAGLQYTSATHFVAKMGQHNEGGGNFVNLWLSFITMYTMNTTEAHETPIATGPLKHPKQPSPLKHPQTTKSVETPHTTQSTEAPQTTKSTCPKSSSPLKHPNYEVHLGSRVCWRRLDWFGFGFGLRTVISVGYKTCGYCTRYLHQGGQSRDTQLVISHFCACFRLDWRYFKRFFMGFSIDFRKDTGCRVPQLYSGSSCCWPNLT